MALLNFNLKKPSLLSMRLPDPSVQAGFNPPSSLDQIAQQTMSGMGAQLNIKPPEPVQVDTNEAIAQASPDINHLATQYPFQASASKWSGLLRGLGLHNQQENNIQAAREEKAYKEYVYQLERQGRKEDNMDARKAAFEDRLSLKQMEQDDPMYKARLRVEQQQGDLNDLRLGNGGKMPGTGGRGGGSSQGMPPIEDTTTDTGGGVIDTVKGWLGMGQNKPQGKEALMGEIDALIKARGSAPDKNTYKKYNDKIKTKQWQFGQLYPRTTDQQKRIDAYMADNPGTSAWDAEKAMHGEKSFTGGYQNQKGRDKAADEALDNLNNTGSTAPTQQPTTQTPTTSQIEKTIGGQIYVKVPGGWKVKK